MILHNDIDMPFAKTDAEPVYLSQMKALLQAASEDDDHLGAHRPRPRSSIRCRSSAEAAERIPTQLEIVEAMLADPALTHVNFDISWDEVAEVRRRDRRSRSRASRRSSTRIPDRFLFGTDEVAPAGAGSRTSRSSTCGRRSGGCSRRTPACKVRMGNYERIFDEGRRRVRAWEAANVK